MRKVFLFSSLLVVGLAASQYLPGTGGDGGHFRALIEVATLVCLAFIMIRAGQEFELNRRNMRSYATDYAVAAVAAALPWILCTLYFVFVLASSGSWRTYETWVTSLFAGRFAAPTSAGILFAMLGAAGLSASWMFRKARVLAIFDDLDTIILLVPLQAFLLGVHWQFGVIVLVAVLLLWLAWRHMHDYRIPSSWPWLIAYGAAIVGISLLIRQTSYAFNPKVPIHIEVLLPAFVLGCIMAKPRGVEAASSPQPSKHGHGTDGRAITVISALFMVMVGLSMPALDSAAEELGWAMLGVHALVLTLLANLGKMFPLFVYRSESTFRQRLALCVGMWPRGEVGAGILALALSYGIGGPIIAVASISLALNLAGTGLFILIVKRLLSNTPEGTSPTTGGITMAGAHAD